ncbi:MAG: biotin/lipoate A/B protein ligase family protein [Candidatus Jordarchaeales archaeon]
MEIWRYIDFDLVDPPTSGALAEAMLIARAEGKCPDTFFIYRRKPPAVSIGYFQAVKNTVDLAACRELGVEVSRRITGGGAIYSDENGIIYSIVVSEGNPKIPRNIAESYSVLCRGLIDALKILGLDAVFQPINDILVGGKKVSGSSQTRRRGVVLHHGTLLVRADIETMKRVLKIPEEKMSDKAAKSLEERVTSLEKLLGREVSMDEVKEAVRKGFEKALEVKFEDGELTEYEKKLVRKLVEEKYSRDEWNLKR